MIQPLCCVGRGEDAGRGDNTQWMQVWVASPKPVAATLAAAYVAGADALITIGGAQAVAAMAYGIPGKVSGCGSTEGPRAEPLEGGGLRAGVVHCLAGTGM